MKVISQFNSNQILEANAKSKPANAIKASFSFGEIVHELAAKGHICIGSKNNTKQLDLTKKEKIHHNLSSQDEEENVEDLLSAIGEIINASKHNR